MTNNDIQLRKAGALLFSPDQKGLISWIPPPAVICGHRNENSYITTIRHRAAAAVTRRAPSSVHVKCEHLFVKYLEEFH